MITVPISRWAMMGTRLSLQPLLPRGLALLGRYGDDKRDAFFREEQQLVARMEEKELRDWKASISVVLIDVFGSIHVLVWFGWATI